MKNKEPQSLFFTYGIKNERLLLVVISSLCLIRALIELKPFVSFKSTLISEIILINQLVQDTFLFFARRNQLVFSEQTHNIFTL